MTEKLPLLEKTDLMRRGFVGYDKDGHFVHYCHCGEWGAFGVGYFPLQEKFGTWYCKHHRPDAFSLR